MVDGEFEGDRPIVSSDSDRLGFRVTAKRLSKALLQQHGLQGLVVGLEGRWGSGKSSLLNLLLEELGSVEEKNRPGIVNFRPWLVGERDALLAALFNDLAIAIDRMKPRKGAKAVARKLDRVAEHVRSFGSGLSGIAKAAKLAGLVVPGLGFAGDVIEQISETSNSLQLAEPLVETKRQVADALATLDRPIVVAVDDIDRLEPAEAAEVLRLVRSVADFPNVIYVLCYDALVLSESIKTATGVSDGMSYLEKILQVVVPVPIPEAFNLRIWFRNELAGMVNSDNDLGRQRLERAVDAEGAIRLDTPRAVVRALNGIRFSWPAVQGLVDPADLVWLQLIKAHNLSLYRWIEDYCTNSSVVQHGTGVVSDEEAARKWASLSSILQEDGISYEEAQHSLAEVLPGITYAFNGDRPKLFQKMGETQIDRAIADKRLASPDHYRLFFALAEPANAPRQEQFVAFWNAANTSQSMLEEVVTSWIRTPYASETSLAEVMFDRIRRQNFESVDQIAATNILLGLGNVLDGTFGASRPVFGRPAPWSQTPALVQRLLERMDSSPRRSAIEALFASGAALDWLTYFLRDQTFAYGRVSGASRGDKVLTEEELDLVSKIMVGRYRKLSIDDVLKSSSPTSLLYGWLQAGDAIGPKALLESSIPTNAGLLRVLDKLSSVVRSSEGDYRSLSRANLQQFLDYDAIRQRVKELTRSSDELAELAKKIYEYFESSQL